MDKKIFKNSGFTTVELLVTVTILAVLAILIVVAINPVDLLKQGRDSNRVAALNSINGALRFLTENEPGTFIGTSSVVYVSIPSTISNCSNLGLPTLPTGWTYNCVLAASSTRVDGTGWIPVNFQAISAGSPISQLPIDSKNSTSTRNYFTYVASGSSWELAFSPEAEKNKLGGANNLTIKDGGQKASLFELGKDLNLLPVDYGDSSLVGYWDFEEATGTIAYDRSGRNATGTWAGAGTHYSSGRVGNYAGQFNGSDNYVGIPSLSGQSSVSDWTVAVWLNLSSCNPIGRSYVIDMRGNGSTAYNSIGGFIDCAGIYEMNNFQHYSATAGDYSEYGSSVAPSSLNSWVFVTIQRRGSSQFTYVDGKAVAMVLSAGLPTKSNSMIFTNGGRIGTYSSATTGNYYFNGSIDDVRIYNRALSAAEILALYGAVKQ